MVSVFIVLYVTRTLSTYTSNFGNLHTSTVQLYGELLPPLIWPSHVVRYPCGRERNIEMYLYTKSMPTLGFVKLVKLCKTNNKLVPNQYDKHDYIRHTNAEHMYHFLAVVCPYKFFHILHRARHINVLRMVGETCLHSDFISREHAECILTIVRHTNAEHMYH